MFHLNFRMFSYSFSFKFHSCLRPPESGSTESLWLIEQDGCFSCWSLTPSPLTLSPPPLSLSFLIVFLSLSLSLSHTHTRTHTCTQKLDISTSSFPLSLFLASRCVWQRRARKEYENLTNPIKLLHSFLPDLPLFVATQLIVSCINPLFV